jgi:hypothetical protein
MGKTKNQRTSPEKNFIAGAEAGTTNVSRVDYYGITG